MKRFVLSAFWRLTLASVIILLFVLGLYFLRDMESIEMFSKRKSPDGSLVAENVMFGDGEAAGGRLVVGAKGGSKQSMDLGETKPDLFLRWLNDRNLELWTEGQPIDLRGKNTLGDVRLIAKSFVFPTNAIYDGPGAHMVFVPEGRVIATFRQVNGSCVLTLGVSRDPSYDAANVEIAASSHLYLGIDTRFTLEFGPTKGRQSTLTSATVSNIPSYNRLPTDDQGLSVRGQFLGEDADTLIKEIAKSSVTLDFSRDFFEQVVDYELPLSGVATPVAQFRHCIGDAKPL